jgi:hypothetical protein
MEKKLTKTLPGYTEEMQQAAKSAAASVHDDFWDEVAQLQAARETGLVQKRPMRESV